MARLVREAIEPAPPGSRPASPTPTAASTGSRCRAASPTRDEVDALFLAAGRTGKGVVLATAGRAVHLRRHVRVAAAHRPAVHLPAVRARRAAGTTPQLALHEAGARHGARRSGRRSRRGRSPCSSRWPSPFSLNVGTVFGELHGRRAATPASPRTAIPSGGRGPRPTSRRSPMQPRWETCEVSESDAVPRAGGPAGRRARARARLQPARRDVRGRARRGPRHPLPHLHRQRRRRTR